ncbi:hypothetical protein CC85DRAFT_126081 [Cutaneotrichosporon oleaginosum]|uniref:Uncharacterized protein n=1 Tax=Cutaneotrichosporon oleaginosum TaxID=879819 RepID=A0A0J0XJK5_9TREE|nr:uncharacterized protein CC85DRAFT_126081 [Cutaneotrichosporon oleaginosum]KLT41236.1 hypothetical protein CC85DRAFT_126081 [Cutaneotrichosporon oleaginosum]TXT05499.1 hypothetical protein COLE_06819 [Cutaneotrichosporon oleaginosum]
MLTEVQAPQRLRRLGTGQADDGWRYTCPQPAKGEAASYPSPARSRSPRGCVFRASRSPLLALAAHPVPQRSMFSVIMAMQIRARDMRRECAPSPAGAGHLPASRCDLERVEAFRAWGSQAQPLHTTGEAMSGTLGPRQSHFQFSPSQRSDDPGRAQRSRATVFCGFWMCSMRRVTPYMRLEMTIYGSERRQNIAPTDNGVQPSTGSL